jgi:hypothetical protein
MATTTAVVIDRSGPAVRAALGRHAPEDCARFESEFRLALRRADDDLDLAPVERVLRRWHALATMAANPLTAEERDQVARAKAGDVTGLRQRADDGTWVTL